MNTCKVSTFLLIALLSRASTGLAVELTYSAFEIEAATEYQVTSKTLDPGFVRLVTRSEIAVTDNLALKSTISPCLGRFSTEPEGVRQCAKSRLLEEFTLNGGNDNLDFTVGRQIITQGNTEGFILLDRFNGRDMCRFARLDMQNKLPNWLARGRAFFGDSSLALIVAPFSAESEFPDQDSYCSDQFHNPGQFQALDDPDNNRIADWAGGMEFNITRDSWGVALNLLSTREDLFVLQTVPTFKKTRPRTLWLGGSASATLGSLVLRAELAFAPNRTLTLNQTATLDRLKHGVTTTGVDERWNLLTVVGAEIRHGDWYESLQYYAERIEGEDNLIQMFGHNFLSLRVRRTFANEEVVLSSFAVMDLDYRDFALGISLDYELTKDLNFEVGGAWYDDLGDKPGFFGSYVGRENLYLSFKRSF